MPHEREELPGPRLVRVIEAVLGFALLDDAAVGREHDLIRARGPG